MGDRYIVVVDHDFLLAGRVAQLSARNTVVSQQTILAAQRLELEQLGDTLTGGLGQLGTAAVTALNHVDVTRTLQPPAGAGIGVSGARKPYVVLEALGALVLDEDDVASSSVVNIAGLEVIANQQLDAPVPVATAPATGPDPWHRTQIGITAGHAFTGDGVLVGVLDTGVDATHQEFATKTIHFNELNAAGQSISTVARDAGDHGTHVCGILAGCQSGVAPKASLAVAAVLTVPTPSGLSGSTVQIATGLNWLLSHPFRPGRPGVDIVNASLGVGVPVGGAARTGYYAFLQTIVRTALRAPGVLLIASIGNDGVRGEGFHGSPGNYHNVLGVGATDRTDRVTNFSDWDGMWQPPLANAPIKKPDVCAPGDGVVSARPGGGYQSMSGTSMASPVVTGVGALLLEQDPTLIGDPGRLRMGLESLATVAATPFPPNLGGLGRIKV